MKDLVPQLLMKPLYGLSLKGHVGRKDHHTVSAGIGFPIFRLDSDWKRNDVYMRSSFRHASKYLCVTVEYLSNEISRLLIGEFPLAGYCHVHGDLIADDRLTISLGKKKGARFRAGHTHVLIAEDSPAIGHFNLDLQ